MSVAEHGATRPVPGHEFTQPKPLPPGPLSKSQLEQFYTDGFVIAPGLLSAEDISSLQAAEAALEKAQDSDPQSRPAQYKRLAYRGAWRFDDAFRRIATESPIAEVAAQLTPTKLEQRGVVVVNDAYFRFCAGDAGCGFHVDDPFFWPAKQGEPGPGVNVWIPLCDVGEGGGGLTVVPGSFSEEFVKCREAIAAVGQDGQGRPTGPQTCQLAKLDPALNEKLVQLSVSPTMRAGDVMFCTRYLFHRANNFKEGSGERGAVGIGRYSLRYMPGEAVVHGLRQVDGKLIRDPPVQLKEADGKRFPAVEMEKIGAIPTETT